MEKKAQGALEYLLLIGGALIVAAVVIALALSIASSGSKIGHDALEGSTSILQKGLDDISGSSVVLRINPEESGSISAQLGYHGGMSNEVVTASTEEVKEGVYSIKLVANDDSMIWKNYTYMKIWSGNYTIKSGDVLKYNTYIHPDSEDHHTGIEAHFVEGGYLRWTAMPPNNIAQPVGQWNNFEFGLSSFTGKTIYEVMIVKDGDNAGGSENQFIAYYDNIRLVNTGG